MSKQKPILGIIGGGQLGSMLSQAAKKIGIKMLIMLVFNTDNRI